jgi:hypothetical protein
MKPGAALRVDRLLEGGNIHGFSDEFRNVRGGRDDAYVDPKKPGDVYVRRNAPSGNLFFSSDLPMILLEESWHVVQLSGYAPGKEVQKAWNPNWQRWENEARGHAEANYVP